MQLTIDDAQLCDKLELRAKQDGVSVQVIAKNLLTTALDDEEAAVEELEKVLQLRMDEIRRGEGIVTTVEEIFTQARKDIT